MNKKSLFPVLFLMVAFVIVLFADDSLFEGIKMNERLLMTNNVNNAYVILQAGTVLDPACGSIILGGTNGVGKTILEACSLAGIDRTILKAGSTDSIILNYQTGAITLGNSGVETLLLGHTSQATSIPSLNVAVGQGANWGQGDLVWSGVGTVLTNRGSFTSLNTITASNFVQSAGSAGGFVGNGSGLTNLPGSGVGGFTAGSTIFAGTTGALSQDNANYFWDITNRRLGVGLNTGLLAKVHAVATNGVVFTFMGDSYSTTTNPEDAAGFIGRRARGTAASPTAVQSGDVLSIFTGRGYGTTGFSSIGRSRMQMEASETWTDAAQGSRMVFYVTPSTTTNTFESMRIHNDGSVGIGTNTTVSATKLYVSGSIGASTSIYAAGSPLISATNTFIGVSVGGVTGDLSATYVTNVFTDLPSIAAVSFADISYVVPSSIITNMVVNLGNAAGESGSLMVNGFVSSNGFITIRARNFTAIAVDQGNVPYRISVDKIPTLNTLP